jgi:hypothetical protein
MQESGRTSDDGVIRVIPVNSQDVFDLSQS